MELQILTKRVKLEGSDVDTFVKSKWTETSIEFEVLVRDRNVLLTSVHLKDDLINKKHLKVTFDQLFKALSSTSTDETFYFKYSRKFEIFKRDDDDDYSIIYLSLPNMKETKLTEDVTEIIARQMEDLAAVCDKYEAQSNLLAMAEKEMEDLNEQYFTLSKGKEDYERNSMVKCCALIDAKKKFIREGMHHERVNDSSFDMREFVINDGLKQEPPRPLSPVPCTSSFVPKNVTPKSQSSQKRKRTPSKKLFAQISQHSDSDDVSFEILPDVKSEKRESTENPDTSSIFKDFKVRTPKKLKREEKESSIEAKMDDNSIRPRQLSSPDIDSNPLDVFKCSDDILSQAIDHEMEDFSQPKKNPFSVDTINILEM